jgi:photosystem II stability/assembly factor-like uncharacterized protein
MEDTQTAQNQIHGQFENQQNLPVQRRSAADADVVKAKDLAAGQAASTGVPAPMTASSATGAAVPAATRASLRWAISASGSLQRSLDAGNTWEDVNVGSYSTVGALQKESTVEYKAEAKKSTKQNKQAAATPVFRAVAAIDPEVWAGGSGAILYHSVDSGAHWMRVLPSDAGILLAGDIISLEFSDPENGRIATSAGQIWTTADAGRTWHKQQ